MIQIRDSIDKLSNDGKRHIIADIDIDTASELPSQEYGDIYFEMGSIAHDISTGNFYSLDSSGTWYNQDGTGAYSDDSDDSESDSEPEEVSSPKSIAQPDSEEEIKAEEMPEEEPEEKEAVKNEKSVSDLEIR